MYSYDQKHFIIEEWYKTRSVIAIRRCYKIKYGLKHMRDCPSRHMIRNLIKKFETKHVIANQTGLKKTCKIRTLANVNTLGIIIASEPKLSIRKLSQSTKISIRSVRRILKKDLKAFPYKRQSCEKINNADKLKRLQFAYQFKKMFQSNPKLLENMWFSDEAYFTLDEAINKQNQRYWAVENPHITVEREAHGKKILIWAAISMQVIIGPYFIDCHVNSDNYLKLMNNKFIPELRRKKLLSKAWFQQDGAPPHCAKAVLDSLRSTFGGRVISRGCDHEWPPRSPDLSPLDYYLWGTLKSRVYVNHPVTTCQLKKNIAHEMKKISKEDLCSVFSNFLKRLDKCLDMNGGHFEYFK